jgi:hypothetical protein
VHHPPSQSDNAWPKPHPHHHQRVCLLSHGAATARSSAAASARVRRTLAAWPALAGRPDTADTAAAGAPPAPPVPPTNHTPPRIARGPAQRPCPHRPPHDPHHPPQRRSPTPPAAQPQDRHPDRHTTPDPVPWWALPEPGNMCARMRIQPRQRLQTGGRFERRSRHRPSPTSTAPTVDVRLMSTLCHPKHDQNDPQAAYDRPNPNHDVSCAKGDSTP